MPIALCALAGAILVSWIGWLAAEPTPAVVDVVGPCSPTTRRWVETWRRTPSAERAVVRVSVLCRPDGRTSSATLVYSPSSHGPGAVSWSPVTTYFGVLPPHGAERVDIFDHNRQLVEYATVDRQTRRLEFYSAASRPTGHGRIKGSFGRVERSSADGRRHESMVMPIPPDLDDD